MSSACMKGIKCPNVTSSFGITAESEHKHHTSCKITGLKPRHPVRIWLFNKKKKSSQTINKHQHPQPFRTFLIASFDWNNYKIKLLSCWISDNPLWGHRKSTTDGKTYAQKYLRLISTVFKRFTRWNQSFSQQFYVLFKTKTWAQRRQVSHPNHSIDIYTFDKFVQ